MSDDVSRVRDLLRVPPGSPAVVRDEGTRDHPLVKDKATARAQVEALGPRLAELQSRLYAEGQTGGTRRVVVVLQAMDTGGKDGAVKRVLGLVNPAGVSAHAFAAPTPEELSHDFLWRVKRALPAPGMLGVFNRSHYEDVLIVRVHDLVPRDEWERRYDLINAWEAEQAAQGVVFLKCFLHISAKEQRERLLARLDDPAKYWKIDPADLEERRHWDAYQEAYGAVLSRCSTDVAPWYVVPADRKWHRDWALAHLLLETLEEMAPRWPARPDLDLEGMRRALGG